MIDGLGGNDTIQLRYGADASGADLAANLSNIEVLDLNVAGVNNILNLSLQDVLDMTDLDNKLTINGTADDRVSLFGIDAGPLTSNWTLDNDLSNASYNVYTSTNGTNLATLEIQTGIIIE